MSVPGGFVMAWRPRFHFTPHVRSAVGGGAVCGEDLFADSRMPLGEHLEALRRCLWRALVGFGLTLAVVLGLDGLGYATDSGVGVAKPVLDAIARPVETTLQAMY